MATTGTYNFNPGLGEITIYAYMNVGIRPTALLQEHMEAARMGGMPGPMKDEKGNPTRKALSLRAWNC